ncbi:hypothetical protein FA95DRAFT_1565301 [Auriscalpium vulgare]|uniref:Uncharacterized protein n=1 Tax=Auriscalpium vulgare TaxID=40419 RepID=A0ACB8RD65_9AGAM|nr:hypothetical protein FA95DRAFT_1565301 [Auriscalpium vulgare]
MSAIVLAGAPESDAAVDAPTAGQTKKASVRPLSEVDAACDAVEQLILRLDKAKSKLDESVKIDQENGRRLAANGAILAEHIDAINELSDKFHKQADDTLQKLADDAKEQESESALLDLKLEQQAKEIEQVKQHNSDLEATCERLEAEIEAQLDSQNEKLAAIAKDMKDARADLNGFCQHLMLKDARDLLIARYNPSPSQDVSMPLQVGEKLDPVDRALLDDADLKVIFDRSALAFSGAESDVDLRTSLGKIFKFCSADSSTLEREVPST